VPAPGPQPQPPAQPIVTLWLPPEKAVYLSLYRSNLRLLQHRVNRSRRTAQRAAWDRALDPRRAGDMSLETFCRGRSMQDVLRPGQQLSHRDILRPRWTAAQFWPDMEVDHRIEMQVTTIGGERQFDQPWNYELLDDVTNGTSGNSMRLNILAERQRLATTTGDPTWLTRDILQFHQVMAQPGAINAGRWTYEQVRDGEHIDVYEFGYGGVPDQNIINQCINSGGRSP
jgi:hypothetical protein